MKKFTDKQKINLRKRAFRFGENLMPCDCADIIAAQYKQKSRREYGIREMSRMIMDMMESCGFWCDRREALEAALYL